MGTLTSTPHPFNDLLVARTLDLKCEQIPLRVMNLSNQPQRINKGTELARCETVSADCTSEADVAGEVVGTTQKVEKETKLSPHLTDLYDRSTGNLTKSESLEVFKLLCEFADIFSTGPNDLGCTNLVRHHINAGDAAPIWLPPR